MDRYLSRKRPHSPPTEEQLRGVPPANEGDDDASSTDIKLAQLVSLFVDIPQDTLLDILVSCGGSVEDAVSTISTQCSTKKRVVLNNGRGGPLAIQTSLTSHIILNPHKKGEEGEAGERVQSSTVGGVSEKKPKSLVRKGRTLHLFSPEDIAAHTPCTIIHNFLPPAQANALLLELLDESQHFSRYQFQLFDRTVQSPHSTSVYVATPEEEAQHTTDYTYGGTYRSNIRQATPHLRAVSAAVQRAVNEEIQKRIRSFYPGAQKLRFQSPREWIPNAAFVNCYDGPAESVGYHSDELTYLGPRPVIGSLSLGVQREFRVRRIVPDDNDNDHDNIDGHVGPDSNHGGGMDRGVNARTNAQGQISITLPHNSLLVMHADMQEEWKHAIVPAQRIEPHPLSGNRRINITYRWYRDSLHPRNIPRCKCGKHAILKCVQRKRETKGRYMWLCFMGYTPGNKGCGFFQWAEFDDDGEPVWRRNQTRSDADEVAPKLSNFAS